MEIFQIVGLGVVATILAIVIKAHRPEIAIQISLLTGIIILVVILGKISAVVDLLNSYAQKVNIDLIYFSTLLKIIGIAYIAEFGAEVCRDAGEGAIASKVELAGKVIIILLAVPIITSLLDLIISILP
ncbi:MAG TPA: stage III sporulation protein AD [Acetivibrio sp.]|nr:stage III sporulation protein AD [Clostridium sp.]HOQ38634.1 stage III sporulation protein AD [Acetivibrio sp.]HPT92073.1 stage III sporulation protein AD [Acetivibrio sp.]HQA58587.1 stage III sporulation protein AD [Acetivibrio sp.]